MKYNFILIRYGELALKGKNRSFFEKTLLRNIKNALKSFSKLRYDKQFARLLIELNGEPHEAVVERLKDVFGIYSFSLVLVVENDTDAMKEAALRMIEDQATSKKSFKITTKRANKQFPIQSMELSAQIGSYVLQRNKHIHVDVHNPDIEIQVEIREKNTYISSGAFMGAGGLPVGTGGKVLLLLSGGIDSPVASYLAMKRGAKVDAIHFHSPPYTSERAKQKVIDLAKILTKYGTEMTIHFVPFTAIQKHINEHIHSHMQMTVTRRMMMRISEKIAQKENILALATGESLGQVASQTLHSMNAINEVTNMPILRPLVTMDKEEVVTIARDIGTYETSILPYEDCCTIFLPDDPATKPTRAQSNKSEQFIDVEKYVEEAVQHTEKVVITHNTVTNEEIEHLF